MNTSEPNEGDAPPPPLDYRSPSTPEIVPRLLPEIDGADHFPTLEYRSPDANVLRSRPRRRTLPKPFGIAFIATAIPLAGAWLGIDSRNVFMPHLALYVAGTGAVVGIVMLGFARLRLAAAGVLVAVGLWMLMLGSCYGLGGVPPTVF